MKYTLKIGNYIHTYVGGMHGHVCVHKYPNKTKI